MKPTNIIAGILAIIALAGDVLFMFVLVAMGQTVSTFSALGNTPDVQELTNTFSFALNLGWVWAIIVLVTCLFAIKFAFLDSRKKK